MVKYIKISIKYTSKIKKEGNILPRDLNQFLWLPSKQFTCGST